MSDFQQLGFIVILSERSSTSLSTILPVTGQLPLQTAVLTETYPGNQLQEVVHLNPEHDKFKSDIKIIQICDNQKKT